MDTLKTAFVVLLLLAVLYGVYVVLNKPTEPLPFAEPWPSEPVPELAVEFGDANGDGTAAAAELGAESATLAAPSWTMPASMPETQAAEMDSPGTLAAAPPQTLTAPDLLPQSDPPRPEQLPLASQLAEQQWPTEDEPQNAPDDVAVATNNSHYQPANSTYQADVYLGQPTTDPESTELTRGTDAVSNAPDSLPLSAYVPAEGTSGNSDVQPYGQTGTGAVPPYGQSDAGEVQPYSPFDSAIQSASTKVADQQWHDALWTLSLFYGSPDLTAEQQQQLQDWLDPLAAKVVYSREHLLENPYQVQAGETLESIAAALEVPWQLLANINGLRAAGAPPAGTALKVVRGPIRAEVDLTQSFMTVFVGKLYAGRFPISVGTDQSPEPGDYKVQEKLPGRTYYAGDGQTISPDDPANPFGKVWIDLGGGMCIHGDASAAPAGSRGCIGLSTPDANDIYGILSEGSAVTILR